MRRYILALDQGTTSSRAILFDSGGAIASAAQREFPQIFPKPGWVEHDAEAIWSTQIAVAREAMQSLGAEPDQIAGIGIANQRETTVVWNRDTGRPIHNAIVWQDRRTAAICDRLQEGEHSQLIKERTGLVADAYFSGSKVQWLLDKVPGSRDLAGRGKLAFGTIDSWLVWKLTGGKRHVTDVSNASRTMLFNIERGEWDEELLELLEIPESLLPTVHSSSEVYAETELLGGRVPIAGIAGDQQAALFGQLCVRPGMVKSTYGTGCFILMNTGRRPHPSKDNLLTTVAWKIGDRVEYALEGSVFVGGAVVQWLRDGLGIIESSSRIEELASRVPDNGGVYFVPAFAGLGAPHWDQYARGAIVGLTRGSTSAHLARAALEGIAYQVRDVLEAMRAATGIPLEELRVDGGASANDLLMQFQADLLDIPVVRSSISETTALGAACLAGLAVGFWRDQSAIAQQWEEAGRFRSRVQPAQRKHLLDGWEKALERAKGWAG